MKTIKYSGKIILLLLFYTVAACLYSSCSTTSTEKKISEIEKTDALIPPVSVVITNPIMPSPDTCSPPRTIIIPTKSSNQTITLRNGKLLKLAPPEIKSAGFFSQMEHYSTDNGLAMDGIGCSIMDKKGNLWFGTKGGGVSRYDGKSFTNYTTAQGLGNDIVESIAEDRNGNFWFGTYGGGVSCYDGKSFTNYTTAQGLANNIIISIVEDKIGNLWFGTYGGGVSRYDGNRVDAIEKGEKIPIQDQHDLKKINGKFVKSFTNYTTLQGLANNTVWSIVEDNMGDIWFGTNGGGISRYGRKRVEVIERGDSIATQAQKSLEKSDSKPAKTFTNYTTAQGLAGNIVWSIMEDKIGNLWFGTYGGGVSRYDGNRVEAIERGDLIAQQTQQDLKKINGKFIKTFTNFSTSEGLTHSVVLSILEDRRGDIWFGTFGGGVSRYDGNRMEVVGEGDIIVQGIQHHQKIKNKKSIRPLA